MNSLIIFYLGWIKKQITSITFADISKAIDKVWIKMVAPPHVVSCIYVELKQFWFVTSMNRVIIYWLFLLTIIQKYLPTKDY